MSDVFISYKAEDRPRVQPLVDALESEGLSVWWDARVGGGEAWRESIAEHLDAARCVLVVWSKRSTGPEGRFVRDEASRSQHRGTYLPVTLDKVQPPLGFGEMQALSLTGWKGDGSDPRYRAVSACVHSMLGREASSPTSRGSARQFDRRTAIVGGGVALVGAAAGAWLLLRPARADANTIAVLPFANLSGDRSQDYFSDGMAEEVRTALAAAGGLEVVARTSSEMLRNADAISAGRKLSVANVITGSVRRSPSTVRVSAQLVDGKSGLERWSQSFDRPMGDVLQIQSDIAANVARALSVELGHGPTDRAAFGGTANPEAQDLYLQATALERDDSSEGLLRRIALMDRATALDPNYAEAYAKKAIYQTVWGSTWASNDAEKKTLMAAAFASARQAVKIRPTLAMGYAAMGLAYTNNLQINLAAQALSRAVSLPGTDAAALTQYGLVLSRTHRQAEGEAMIDRATTVDPLNAQAWAIKGWVLFQGRRYREAVDASRHALSIAPQHLRARSILAWSLIFLGHNDPARRELQQMPADDYRRLVAEATIAARSGRKQDAALALAPLSRRYGDAAQYQVGEIYAQIGDRDQAIKALQSAWKLRDSGLSAIQVDPFLDPVRGDPRFAGIVKQVFG